MSVVIRFEDVSKLYRLGQVGTGTLSADLTRMWARFRGKEDPFLKIGQTNDRTKKAASNDSTQKPSFLSRISPLAARDSSDLVWALKDINFEVKEGEVLGIIGRNGAGKSTLLKLLARVTQPTTGQIKVRGRIASLLEVGTGFHPDLTGRENIFLNGAILGMRKHEIHRKLDEIIDFSGCERYIDTPVKRYSSGMYVRLAFAVAAHLDPEILIIDEVLAVGDVEFQKKCLGKMQDVATGGRTVLFVSHNMTAVASLCNRGVLLQNGGVALVGSADDAINAYNRSIDKSGGLVWEGSVGDGRIEVTHAQVFSEMLPDLRAENQIIFEFELHVHEPIHGLVAGWEIWDHQYQLLAYSLADDALPPPAKITPPGFYRLSMQVPANTFASGSYHASLDIGIHNVCRVVPDKSICLRFDIDNIEGIGRRYLNNHRTSILRPDWAWVISEH